MFLVVTTRDVDLSLELFYSLMFFFLIIKVLLYRLDNPKDVVFRTGEYRFWGAPYQIVAGVFIGLATTGLLFVVGTYHPIADPLGEFITQAVFVAFVETLLMVVLVQTFWLTLPVRVRGRWHGLPMRFEWREVPAGIVLWPLVFGFLHPPVRLAWLAGDFTLESIAAFLYGAGWAILFYAIYRLRDHGGPVGMFFGAVTVWTAHVVANLVILSFPAKVGPFEIFPMEFWGNDTVSLGPDWVWLAAVGVVLLVMALFLWRSIRNPSRYWGQEE
jgi:hypothetical protein